MGKVHLNLLMFCYLLLTINTVFPKLDCFNTDRETKLICDLGRPLFLKTDAGFGLSSFEFAFLLSRWELGKTADK